MSGGRFIQKWRNKTKDPWVKRTYKVWCSMRRRCYNIKVRGYPDYGGRGIGVCERWRNDFDAFVSDMGFAPEGLSIERVDVDGDYDPFNCVWATRKAQANNTRSNVRLTIDGRTMTASQWAEEMGIPATRVLGRIRAGWPPEKAVMPEIYEAPHGGDRKYILGCRCDICVEGSRRRRRENYRKKNPVIKNRSKYNPEKEYDL